MKILTDKEIVNLRHMVNFAVESLRRENKLLENTANSTADTLLKLNIKYIVKGVDILNTTLK